MIAAPWSQASRAGLVIAEATKTTIRRSPASALTLLLTCVAVTGCGSTASEKSGAYDSSATASAMRPAGWQASAAKGMPRTVTGTPQVAYLQATTPAGHRIDVQYLKGAMQATDEGAAAEKRIRGFRATVIGNVLAFTPPSGRAPVAATDREALGKLLRR